MATWKKGGTVKKNGHWFYQLYNADTNQTVLKPCPNLDAKSKSGAPTPKKKKKSGKKPKNHKKKADKEPRTIYDLFPKPKKRKHKHKRDAIGDRYAGRPTPELGSVRLIR